MRADRRGFGPSVQLSQLRACPKLIWIAHLRSALFQTFRLRGGEYAAYRGDAAGRFGVLVCVADLTAPAGKSVNPRPCRWARPARKDGRDLHRRCCHVLASWTSANYRPATGQVAAVAPRHTFIAPGGASDEFVSKGGGVGR